MDIGYHGSDVTSAVRLRTLLFAFDIFKYGRFPFIFVALIDRVNLASFRNSHFGVGEDELANGRIQHESIDLLIDGNHHHGSAAIQCITSSYDVSARLQSGFFSIGMNSIVRFLENGKYGADGDQTINIGRAVQGIKCDLCKLNLQI